MNHTRSVVSHVNGLIAKAHTKGQVVTALNMLDGTRFTLTSVHADGVMVVDTATGRYCGRWVIACDK